MHESMLFRGADQPDEPTPDTPELDAVTDEITRWKYIAPAELAKFRCADGLLNEFKLMWELRERFPVHFLVFKCDGACVPLPSILRIYINNINQQRSDPFQGNDPATTEQSRAKQSNDSEQRSQHSRQHEPDPNLLYSVTSSSYDVISFSLSV